MFTPQPGRRPMFQTAIRKLESKLGRFIRRDDGVAAIEFAVVLMPFLVLLFAIMEVALVFFAGQAFETAASDSARLILTGQAQTQGFDQAAFKNKVCGKIYGLFKCNDIKVDVRKYNSFAAAKTWANPIKDGKLDESKFGYQPGGPCEIVVVRLAYAFSVYMPMLDFSDMADGKRLLVATSVFRNEPFQGTCSP
jgi:Flp pilus assembly protein TadG